jgi:uncharacterized protein
MPRRDPLEGCTGFDWDEANAEKNWSKHRVTFWECEEVFFNRPLVRRDIAHSREEPRYYVLGETDAGRLLFVAFTVRGHLIRPISFRDMTRKERKAYAWFAEEDPEVQ